MKEIRTNILECYDKFQLIVLGTSVYQKKSGEIVVPKEGVMRDFVTKFPDLPLKIGSSVGKYGNCPSLVYSIPNTKYPTKILSFPITPTSLRVEDPQAVVIARLAKRFKPYTLLPGWLLRPRMDMLEFSSIKLAEVIKYYKLTDVALVVETLGLGVGDETYYNDVKSMLSRYLSDFPLTLCYLPKEEQKKIEAQENIQSVTGSSYTEDDDEIPENIV